MIQSAEVHLQLTPVSVVGPHGLCARRAFTMYSDVARFVRPSGLR